MSNEPLSPFTRQRIARLAEDVLQLADVVGELPTPMDAVHKAAGVREVLDMSHLPKEVEAKRPRWWKRIIGAMWFEERTIFIDRTEPEPRQVFSDAHEASHAMCPWHEPTLRLRLDNENTIDGRTDDPIEIEAGYGAGHLIFQGGRFHHRALAEQVSIRTPLALAHEYGASRHATLHYYVDEHPDAVALLVAGRYPYADGTLPIWRSVESQEFLRRFGRFRDHLPGQVLSIVEGDNAPLADIVNASRLSVDPPSKEVRLMDTGGARRVFVAEAFFNGRCNLIFVADRKARRLGRRVRLAS